MVLVTSVVVVGSGFTGFECARRLARRLRRTDVDVTIISPVDYMLYTPLLPDVAGGVVDARFVAIPLAGTLKRVRAIRGRVDSVDLEQHRLQFTDLEQRTRELSWDRLVLTPGSVTRLFDIPGLAQYARGLKTTAEALYLRDHVLQQLELSCLEEDAGVGAGSTHHRGGRRVVFRHRTHPATARTGPRRRQTDELRPGLGEIPAARPGRTRDAGGR